MFCTEMLDTQVKCLQAICNQNFNSKDFTKHFTSDMKICTVKKCFLPSTMYPYALKPSTLVV